MFGKLFCRWALLTGLAGPVLLFQGAGCTMDPSIIRSAVLQVIAQTLAFGLDNLVVSMR